MLRSQIRKFSLAALSSAPVAGIAHPSQPTAMKQEVKVHAYFGSQAAEIIDDARLRKLQPEQCGPLLIGFRLVIIGLTQRSFSRHALTPSQMGATKRECGAPARG